MIDFNNPAADRHDEKALAEFETNFQSAYDEVSSAVRTMAMAIANDDNLSHNEKLRRIRALVTVNTADFPLLEQVAVAVDQNQPASLAPAPAPSTPASSTEPSAEGQRLVEIEQQLKDGFSELARHLGTSVVQVGGQIDVAATLNGIRQAADRKISEASTAAVPPNTVPLDRAQASYKHLFGVLNDAKVTKLLGGRVIFTAAHWNSKVVPAMKAQQTLFNVPDEAPTTPVPTPPAS